MSPGVELRINLHYHIACDVRAIRHTNTDGYDPAMAQDDVTQILSAADAGDGRAVERLFPIVYEELRGIAQSHMRRERAEHTLQATALVHEAYARLMDGSRTPTGRAGRTSSPPRPRRCAGS